ncbi:MAG: flagellar basal body rod protein FlgB [Desulfobulbaceae bacterium]|jgi:flagellar basal-body rod protein FlgB|nr:flagellar basal body rod protein FlgB [Desulfobulbaceae bacterium]
MIGKLLGDQTTQVLKKSLDLRAKNQNFIAANIANAETPGYSAVKFQFEDALAQAIDQRQAGAALTATDPRHITNGAASIAAVGGRIVEITDQTGVGDKNSVSVDDEMLELSKNELMFETSAQLLQKKIGLLRYVIAGQ